MRPLFNFVAALSLALCLFAVFAMSTGLNNDHPDWDFRGSVKLFIVTAIIPLIWLVDYIRRRGGRA